MSGAHPVQHAAQASSAAAAGEDSFARDMDAAMARMMDAMHAGSPRGDPDQDFLAMMIPHHEGAVEMAHLVLQHGRDPLTRQLAQEIIAGQGVEIAAMRARLAALGSPGEEYPALGGTRGGGRPR